LKRYRGPYIEKVGFDNFAASGDRRSGHTLDGWLKEEEEPAVTRIASGNFVAGG